jgi:hypothetical protein
MRAAFRSKDCSHLSRWLPALERLEAREVPAVTAALSQVATWADIGPNVTTNSQVRNIGANNEGIGAVQALAFNPADPNTLFAGSPNGGLWRTNNAQAASPTWTPIADQVASLSIADIAIDPDNPNRLVAAVGATADGWQPEGGQANRVRGDLIGLLYTENALAAAPTWRFLSNNLANKNVLNVAIRTGYILAATDQGTFRSADNGVTFSNIYPVTVDNGQSFTTTQFNQSVYDLAENPRLRDQFYLATRPGAGRPTNEVWRTDDGGQTWGRVTDPTKMQLNARTVNVQLAVRDAGAFDNQVYVTVANNNPIPTQTTPVFLPGPEQSLPDLTIPGHGIQYAWQNRLATVTSIVWSANQGGDWTRMDAPRELTDPDPLDYGARDPDGRGNGIAVKNVGGGADINGGVVTIITRFAHRLQTGDRVFVRGLRQWEPPAPNPELVNGFFTITVTGGNSFTLDNFTLSGINGLDSTLGYWQRVVGANPGERGEFLQIATNNLVGNERLFLGGDLKNFKHDDLSDNAFPSFTAPFVLATGDGGPNTYPGLNAYYPGLDDNTRPISFTNTIWVGNRNTLPTATSSFSSQWDSQTDVGTPGLTSPGGDTRELLLQANTVGTPFLWVATGTGIYRRQIDPVDPDGPNLPGRPANFDWTSANGNISVGQFWSAGYDSLNNVVAGATQDTGAVESGANSNTYTGITSTLQRNVLTDQEYSYVAAVDNTSIPGRSIRYYAMSNFGNIRRREFDATNTLVFGGSTTLNLANQLTTTTPLSGITGGDLALAQDTSARIILGLNNIDRRRGVYGLTSVYEDSDPNGVTGFVVSNVTPPGMIGRVSALAYGGKRAGINFNQILAVGTNSGQLWLRSEFGITFNQIAPLGPGGGQVTDIEFDPDDYRRMFVVQGGRVFETTNAVTATPVWTEVSAGLQAPPDPLTGLPSNGALTTQIRTIALFDPNPGTANVGATGDVILLAGGRGGVFRRSLTACGTGAVWSEYGNGMPNSVVMDLQFDSTGNRLTAATFGRGVWSIPDVRPTLNNQLFLDIIGDAGDNSITVQADPLDPNAILVFDGATLLGKFQFGQFDAVRVSGLGGADTIRIGNGTSTRFVNYPITVNAGGDVGDSLIIDSSGATANVQATVQPGSIGLGIGDNLFSGCGSVTYTGLGSGSLTVNTGSGNDVVVFTAGAFPQTTITNTGAGDDTVLVDGASAGTLVAFDPNGNNDTVVLNVPANFTAVVDSANRVVNVGDRWIGYSSGIESVLLEGSTNTSVVWQGTGLDDTVFLSQDPFLANASQLVSSTPTPGSGQRTRFRNMTNVTVNTLAGVDQLYVDSNDVAAGGSAKFVNYNLTANMGGDAGDGIAVNDSSTAAATRATVFGNSLGAVPSTDNLFGTGGRLLFSGLEAGRLTLDTGSANDTVVSDAAATLQVVWNGNGGANEGLVSGTAGDDNFTVVGGSVFVRNLQLITLNVQDLTTAGGGGNDMVWTNATAGSDSLVVNQSSLDSGVVAAGLPVRVWYNGMERLNVEAAGGANSLLWNDTSNTRYGTPTAPTSGITFAPTGAASGQVRLAAGTFLTFNNVNGNFVMNGDPFGTNSRDQIAVLGVSTAGLATDGELTSANGSDTILPSDAGVSIVNAALGQLRSVTFASIPNNTASSFSTVYVKGGNESGVGDAFAASPTLRTNLLLDGGDPSAAPGDTLTITTSGPASTTSVNDPSLGPPHTRVTNRSDRASVGHLNFEGVTANTVDPSNPGGPPVPSFGSVKADLFAVGSSGGVTATVQAYNLDGSLRFAVAPFENFTGAVRVAVGDVTGDGKSDVVAAAGQGGGPVVSVYDGQTGQLVRTFFAYDPGFDGGVTVAVGNLNTDRFADIITGAGAGGGPQVKAFDGETNNEIASFFAYAPTFINGVNVAAGDVDGDGISDIVTGAGAGGGPHVRVFNGTNLAEIHSFFAFEPAFTGGVNVAVGDMSGDGRADIFVGAGSGGGPHVKVFDGANLSLRQSFFVNDPNVSGAPPVTVSGGVAVAAGDFDNDGLADMLTGRGVGSRPFAQVFKLTAAPTLLLAVNTFGDLYSNGISVGV